MGKTQVHNQVATLLCGTVTDAVNFKLFGEILVHAFNHVVNQGSCKAVETLALLAVIRPLYGDDAALHLDNHAAVKGAG